MHVDFFSSFFAFSYIKSSSKKRSRDDAFEAIEEPSSEFAGNTTVAESSTSAAPTVQSQDSIKKKMQDIWGGVTAGPKDPGQ